MTGEDLIGHEAYWGEPRVTAERESAWKQWVMDYVVKIAQSWVDGGASREDVMNGAAHLFLDWQQIDEMPWMPLGPALLESTGAALDWRGAELEGDARVRYMLAQRTVETSARTEKVLAIAYQTGLDPRTVEGMVEKAAVLAGAPEKGESTALYRHYDADGALLYIGITKSLSARAEQHRRDSQWFQFVADTKSEWHADRKSAERAERTAIKAEGPIFNAIHNKAGRDAAVAYLFDALARNATRSAS